MEKKINVEIKPKKNLDDLFKLVEEVSALFQYTPKPRKKIEYKNVLL